MKLTELSIKDVFIIHLECFEDERGHFIEKFNKKKLSQHGINFDFVQDNSSLSKPGVLRGLHYQLKPQQTKLVSVVKGQIFDVVVDTRQQSPTFGKHVCIELKEGDNKLLFIPHGFAHGFCVIGDKPAEVNYKVDQYWNPHSETGLLWNDPFLNIPWPIKNPLLSPKDSQWPAFSTHRPSYEKQNVSPHTYL